jgi:2-succinyl-5-enolpyruvyl-6-hydroxy-3-cyclohexene-1-carboxylate synthase
LKAEKMIAARENEKSSYRFALAVMEQLVSSGVTTIVASPGFRNSPLTLAAHRTKELSVITAVEERGAAFFALGAAKASSRPVAILCTSGTAVANYFPAVLEANHSHVPLIVITADRPEELIGSGANQATDQTKIFGSHVRFFAELSPKEDPALCVKNAKYVTGKAHAQSLDPCPGPVHLNLRFREPFFPDAQDMQEVEAEEKINTPFKFISSASGPSKEQAAAIESIWCSAKRPLIALGASGYSPGILKTISQISRSHRIPILAESASGMAFIDDKSDHLAENAELVLDHLQKKSFLPPDLIIRFGSPLTGKALPRVLQNTAPVQLIFDEWGEFREPDIYPSIFIQGGLAGWLRAIDHWKTSYELDTKWSQGLFDFDKKISKELEKHIKESGAFTEWAFFHSVKEKVSAGSALFLGNSMPIRDFNSCFTHVKKKLSLYSNRGLSGIDGLIASSLGTSFAAKTETHAFLGDLSTLHDLPSLALASSLRDKINLTLWVMNNNGGEIFRIVSTAKADSPAEWFTTPQEFDLAAIAKSFQIPFTRIHSISDLLALENQAFSHNGMRIIEVMVEKEKNLVVRKTFHPAP